MARPRVFVSSTYYDLKHIRSSIDNFIESLGYDSILSEKGDIAYSPDAPLDESCYREASSADIFVLIIGGRYGSSASTEEKKPTRAFFEKYDSVTKKEYDSAASKDIPIYILLEKNVYSEYHTYLKNQGNKINYAHVDSVNIFELIRDILSKKQNNPIQTFEKFSEIELWLKEQWAGLFREFLQKVSSQKQISTLSSQVETLSAINSTLQIYLEAVVSKIDPEKSQKLIESERSRLNEIEQLAILKTNRFFIGAFHAHNVKIEAFKEALIKSKSFAEFATKLSQISSNEELMDMALRFENMRTPIEDINEARVALGLTPFPLPKDETHDLKMASKGFRSKKQKLDPNL